MLKILYVEDDQGFRIPITGVLKNEGYHVEIAEDGIEALEKYQDNNFDLVITDYKMPGMNGLELIKRIREVNSEQKIILMTGSPEEMSKDFHVRYSNIPIFIKLSDDNKKLTDIIEDFFIKK